MDNFGPESAKNFSAFYHAFAARSESAHSADEVMFRVRHLKLDGGDEARARAKCALADRFASSSSVAHAIEKPIFHKAVSGLKQDHLDVFFHFLLGQVEKLRTQRAWSDGIFVVSSQPPQA